MKKLQEISLRLRIFLTLIFSMLLGVGLLFWLIGSYEIKDYKEHINKESIIQLSAIEASITEVAVIGDYATIKQILHKFITVDQDIINISYKKGSASIDERNIEIEDLYPQFFSTLIDVPNNITITSELNVGGQSYGTIILTIDSTPMINIFWNKTKNVTLILFAILFIQCAVLLILINTSFMPSLYAIQKCSQDLSKGVKVVAIKEDVSPEIKDVLIAFNNMAKAIDTQKKELIVLNQNLEEQVKAKIDELRSKDQLLIQQSKLASMGEMIGAIEHQWRQPLNIVSAIAIAIRFDLEIDNIKKDKVMHNLDDILLQINYLSQTIDDFRNFFRPDNNSLKQNFYINSAIPKVITLSKESFKATFINVVTNIDDFEIYQNENQFIQVLINIFNNVKDAFIITNLPIERYFFIDTKIKENNLEIILKDNAGGIKEDIINKIFEPYFTTKDQSLGTGIGLYISNQIMQKQFNGSIEVSNQEFLFNGIKYKGVEFKLIMPLF